MIIRKKDNDRYILSKSKNNMRYSICVLAQNYDDAKNQSYKLDEFIKKHETKT